MYRRIVINWIFVAIFVAFGGLLSCNRIGTPALLAFGQTLPTQTLDLSVDPPVCKEDTSCPNLSVGSLAGAIFRPDFNTWSLIGNGKPLTFNLNLPESMPVVLTLSVAAALVEGEPNSPVSIMVNGDTLVRQYADTNPNFHPVGWKIPRSMVKQGDNTIALNLTPDATVQYFINSVTVASFGESQRLISSNGTLYTKLYVQFGLANITGALDDKGKPITNEIWTRAYALSPPQPDPANSDKWLPSEDIVPGPTLVYHPGDLLQIDLVNNLNETKSQWLTDFQGSIASGNPDDIEERVGHEINIPHNANNTNLHVHGLHVDPRRDNVTLLIIPEDDSPSNYDAHLQTYIPNATGSHVAGGPPGNGKYWTWLYSYKIPSIHMPGTHWFHAHKHGSTSTHVENGMAGTMVIRPKDESGSFTPGLWNNDANKSHDRLLVLQEIANFGVQQGMGIGDTNVVAKNTPDVTINGIHQPILQLTKDQVERWRIVSAGANHRQSSYFWLGKAQGDSTQKVNGVDVQVPLYVNAVPDQADSTTAQMYLVALDGVTLLAPIKVTAKNPVVLAAGNRADVVVRIPDKGQYALFKNYPAPKNPSKNQLVNPGGLTNIISPTSALNTDPFDLGTNFKGFTRMWPQTVNSDGNLVQTQNQKGKDKPVIAQNQAITPLLGGQANGNRVNVKITTTDTDNLSGVGWTPVVHGGGLEDVQLLMFVNVVDGEVSNGTIPTDLSQLNLSPFSPTGTGTNLPGGETPAYAAPISDSDLNIPPVVMVFDLSAIEFDYVYARDTTITADFKQFSLNGRQFNLTDFVGNTDAQSLIQTPVTADTVYSGTSDNDMTSSPLGTYNFSAGSNTRWTNKIVGVDSNAYWTNPGYYVPVIEKKTTKGWPGTNAAGDTVIFPAGTSYYTYDYSGSALSPPTFSQVTGLSAPSQTQAQSAQEWLLINNSDVYHPFHIHISPFFVTEVGQLNYDTKNAVWTTRYIYSDPPNSSTPPTRQPYEVAVTNSAVQYVVGNWWDVIMIPPHGYVKFKTWINVPWQTDNDASVADNTNNVGSWVFHCHILRHEDRGMMMIVKTKKKPEPE